MIRRFVNLVAANHERCVYSLHRLDVAKLLVYPSTAEAEAANTEEDDGDNGGAGGDDKPRKPSRIERLRQLPEPLVRFQHFPPSHQVVYNFGDEVIECPRVYEWSPSNEMFVRLSPSGRIFHATEAGHAVLYDAGDHDDDDDDDDDDDSAGTITTLPSLNGPNDSRPIVIPIPIASAAAAAADDDGSHGEADKKESLYVMTSHHSRGHIFEFQVLDVSQRPPKWQPLPPPPFASNESIYDVTSFTVMDDVVDGGSTICVSTRKNHTYCFDTRSHSWWHAGDWMLPFDSRAEYVLPELDAWLGLCPSWYNGFDDHGHLCASSDLRAAMDAAHQGLQYRPPTLRHVWEDLTPSPAEEGSIQLSRRFNEIVITRTKEWNLLRGDLISLGGGRFCVAKVFQVQQVVNWGFEDDTETEAEFVVLTGVEVLRDGERDELRMVKHRSRRYMFSTSDRIKIQWVL